MAADPKITLNHFPSSYYSQIARLAFAEKSVPYTGHVVDILSGENYDPHYLEINPACEVPAITVNGRPVPGVQGSQKIMDYLDTISDCGDSRTDHLKGEEFRRRCMGLPITELNVGIVKYPHLVNGQKLSKEVIDRFTRGRVNKREVLEEKMKQYPHLAAMYQEKFGRVKRSDDQKDEKSIKVFLKDLEAFLDETERQLEAQAGDQGLDCRGWLFGQFFTNADIVLAVLLARLEMLGCAEFYWGLSGPRPLLGNYYSRLKERPSFKKGSSEPLSDSCHLDSFSAYCNRYVSPTVCGETAPGGFRSGKVPGDVIGPQKWLGVWKYLFSGDHIIQSVIFAAFETIKKSHRAC